jgi:hypothetical protein
MLKVNYMSYTVHNVTPYSDGVREGYPHFTPNLAKCPNCGALFFLHNLWAKKENAPSEEYRYYEYIDTPSLEDYIKIVEQRLSKTADEEIEARSRLWRALNNIVRGGNAFNPDKLKIWQDNCAALLPLLEFALAQKQKANVEDDGEIDNLIITIAELQRNLEQFDQCAQTINKLGENWEWLKEQFLQKCKSHRRFVFELKS